MGLLLGVTNKQRSSTFMFFLHLDTLGFQWGRALSVTAYFFKNQCQGRHVCSILQVDGVQSITAREVWRQELRVAAHIVSEVRKQSHDCQRSAGYLLCEQLERVHSPWRVSSSFRVDLPILLALIETIPNRHVPRRVSWMILVSIKLTTLTVPIYRK